MRMNRKRPNRVAPRFPSALCTLLSYAFELIPARHLHTMQRLLVVALVLTLAEATLKEPKVNAVLAVTVRAVNTSPYPTGYKPVSRNYTASVGYCSRQGRCSLLPGA